MKDPIETAAYYLARKAKSWDETIKTRAEDIAYYLALEINFYGVLALSLIAGILTGTLFNTIVTISTLLILRHFTGGAHTPTITACFIFSTIAVVVCSTINITNILLHIINLINILFLIWYNRKKSDYDGNGLIWASIIICANGLFLSPQVGLIAFVQLLTIKGGE